MVSLKREINDQKAYQEYLDKMGGIKKTTMSYYQWKQSKRKLKREKDTKSDGPSKSALKRIKQSQEEKYDSLEEALDEKELKRLGYRK